MPLARRLELLQAARASGLWIIEDDYDSEFRYDGAPIPSLQGLDTDGRVIYMGTFSKTMFAGLRMSYMVVPEHIAHAFSNACARIYRPGHLHLQAALAETVTAGRRDGRTVAGPGGAARIRAPVTAGVGVATGRPRAGREHRAGPAPLPARSCPGRPQRRGAGLWRRAGIADPGWCGTIRARA
ncbi:hypothetical protein G6F35_014868 [Rhizopus arrhizus]|nr:hypothetical protein G6F35_014868 [Rhizopus arrhizus]